jgi:O-antigen/teichoic acid export membrane protein
MTARMVNLRRYGANTAFLFLEKGAKLVLTLVVSILLARNLGDRNFGILTYSISYAALFSGLASLGLELLVVRELVNHKEETGVILGTTFSLRFFGGIVIYGLLLLSTLCTQDSRQLRVLISIAGLPMILQAFQVIELFFQARVQAKFTVLVELVALTFYFVSTLALVHWKASLECFALAYLFQSVCVTVGLVIVYRRQRPLLAAWGFDFSAARRLFNDSWPLLLSSMMIPIVQNVDRVLIQHFLNPEMVGNYSVAATLSSVWNTIPIVLCTSLLPAIVEARKIDAQRYHALLQRLHHILFWVSVLIASTASLLSQQIVSILYGTARYPFAATAFSIHVWSIVPMAVGIISSYWLVVEGLQKIYPLRTLMTILVVIAVNDMLIPRMGINGAAVATIVGQVVAVHLIYLPDRRTRPIARMQVMSIVLPLRMMRSLYLRLQCLTA